MKVFAIEEIVANATRSASFDTDFSTRECAAVEIYVVTSNKTGTPVWTFGISALTPDGNAVSKITSANVSDTNTTTRVAVLPGVVAVANVIANDVLPGKARLVATKGSGTSYDIKAYAVFYR